jgi:D-alanyl-D-alanine carboxypeptidase/D-alanyl-D-alanine-endopeptidase (penicillin-binding protein 4)
MIFSRFFFFIIFITISELVFSQKATKDILNLLLEDESLKHASISINTLDLDDNKVILEHNPNTSLIPASTLKVITTATALAVLGPNYQFRTTIEHDGHIKNGILEGNLYLRGFGDPTLASPFMDNIPKIDSLFQILLNKIKAAGILKIKGNVIADGTYFEKSSVAPNWQWEDLGNYYGSGVSGLNIHDNLYILNLKASNQIGDSPEIISCSPKLYQFEFINQLKTADKNSGDNSVIFSYPNSIEAILEGTIPQSDKEFPISGSISNPELFAAEWLHDNLSKNGIEIRGKALCQSNFYANKNRSQIHTHYSPYLIDIIKHTNEFSRNMYCEALIKSIGVKLKSSGGLDSGLVAIKEFWERRNINCSGFYQKDGSGLSARNVISSSTLTNIISNIYQDTMTFPCFKNTLAIAGKTGNFKEFGKNSILENNYVGKGGTLSRVKTYTGYLKTSSNKNIAFTVLVNNFTCSSREMKLKLEKFIIALAENY